MAALLSKRFSISEIPNLAGRTALVTGGSAGIGMNIAMGLALSNAKVLIASATEEHGDEAVGQINKAIKEEGKSGSVTWFPVDLGSLSSVSSLASHILNTEPRLDLCFWNAGIGVAPFGLTADGLGNHFQVNHLAHFLLTDRLLPLLNKTAERKDVGKGEVRIVSTSSELHRSAPPDCKFESVEEVSVEMDPNRLYSRSKLILILFTKELVKRVLQPAGNAILAIAIHPGPVNTDQQQGAVEAYGPLLGNALKGAAQLLFKSASAGAECSLWAGTKPGIDPVEYQGAYVTEPGGSVGTETAQAQNALLAKNLWALSEKVLKEKGYEVKI